MSDANLVDAQQVEQDLGLLLPVLEPARLEELARGLADQDLKEEDLDRLIPFRALRLASALSVPAYLSVILEGLNDPALKASLERARDAIAPLMSKVITHPTVVKRMGSEGAKSTTKQAPKITDAFNVISRISHLPMSILSDSPERPKPVARVAFYGQERLLLESTLEWDDLAFVAKALLTILNGQMRQWQGLATEGRIDRGSLQAVDRHLSAIHEVMAQIAALRPSYASPDLRNALDSDGGLERVEPGPPEHE